MRNASHRHSGDRITLTAPDAADTDNIGANLKGEQVLGRRAEDKGVVKPTMADVARLAGVSTMTVSRALRKQGVIAPATRDRIIDAVEELGYVLDQSAGSLSSMRTGFVAVIVPSINNSNFADTARGITDELEGSGLQVLLGYTDYAVEREEQLIEAMLRRRPEGVILTGGDHTERSRRMLERGGIPVIETWDLPQVPIGDVVGFSNSDATAKLVRHLVGKGYKRFGFVGGLTDRDSRGNQRREGLRSVLAELDLPQDRLVAVGTPPISMAQGSEGVITLLERWPDTQVVLCVSDLAAFGAITACQRRGMRVPDDIAIAGFGNYEISQNSNPTITTIDVACYDMGRHAARRIREVIDERPAEGTPNVVAMPVTIVERESA